MLTMRECFVPRPGYLFCSTDYDGMELKTWAQVCLWSVGQSRLAEVLNAGGDPHTELGAKLQGVSKETAYAARRGDLGPEAQELFDGSFRQTGKIGNFGYPGGMGPRTLRIQARKEYRVKMTLPEAVHLRKAWGEEWPESGPYFSWINSLLKGPRDDQRAQIVHFLSGRVRGDIRYTVTCNTFFQGLAADAAKAAGWALAKECYAVPSSPLYGSRIVNFVHDEFILEVPDHPERAHYAAERQAQVMVEAAQVWVPDVRITASPALMRRWSKNAKTKRVGGMLVPWETAS